MTQKFHPMGYLPPKKVRKTKKAIDVAEVERVMKILANVWDETGKIIKQLESNKDDDGLFVCLSECRIIVNQTVMIWETHPANPNAPKAKP